MIAEPDKVRYNINWLRVEQLTVAIFDIDILEEYDRAFEADF